MISTIQVVNRSDIKSSEVKKVVEAMNTQLRRDFFKAWNIRYNCAVGSSKKIDLESAVNPVMFLVHQKDSEYQGYHDVIKDKGIPYGYCFIDLFDDEPWSATLSHEILELALNPNCDGFHLSRHPERKERRNVYLWREACDPVQCQSYSIKTGKTIGTGNVLVSDFIYPGFFTPYKEVECKNNYLDNIESCRLAEGGYVGYFDPKTGSEETYFLPNDEKAKRRAKIKSRIKKVRRKIRVSAMIKRSF